MPDTGERTKRYIIPRPRNWYNFSVALFVAFGSLSYGYASSISAAVIGAPAWYDYMGLTQGSSYTTSIIGVINCIYSIGVPRWQPIDLPAACEHSQHITIDDR